MAKKKEIKTLLDAMKLAESKTDFSPESQALKILAKYAKMKRTRTKVSNHCSSGVDNRYSIRGSMDLGESRY